jgi:hypothetical protein
VVPADIHDFFFASAGVAGALIGLLFVAISVSGTRLTKAEGASQVHRIRADAALTAFTNALTVSLFALIPGAKIGYTAVALACVGLVFVAASLVSLVRVKAKRWSTARDAFFLVGMAYLFVVELTSGLDVVGNQYDASSVDNIAIVVIFSFLVGVSRAWELIGGPQIGLRHELFGLARGAELGAGETKAPPAEPAPGEAVTPETAAPSD